MSRFAMAFGIHSLMGEAFAKYLERLACTFFWRKW